MRRAEKEIRDPAAVEALLAGCAVGRLGSIGADGYPRVKPVSFAYRGGCLFFHTALQGEKMEDLRRDPRVCFEVDLPVAYVRSRGEPCGATYLYRSALFRGRAVVVEDAAEKARAFGLLMDKYEGPGSWSPIAPERLAAVGVVRIDVEEMVGKEDLGKGALRERAEEALRQGLPLPVTLERD